jgi:phosphoserine aminotransferase
MKKHNFSAGPAILPAPVLKEAAKAVANYQGIDLSLLELSHRGPEFTAVIEEAKQRQLDGHTITGLGLSNARRRQSHRFQRH